MKQEFYDRIFYVTAHQKVRFNTSWQNYVWYLFMLSEHRCEETLLTSARFSIFLLRQDFFEAVRAAGLFPTRDDLKNY